MRERKGKEKKFPLSPWNKMEMKTFLFFFYGKWSTEAEGQKMSCLASIKKGERERGGGLPVVLWRRNIGDGKKERKNRPSPRSSILGGWHSSFIVAVTTRGNDKNHRFFWENVRSVLWFLTATWRILYLGSSNVCFRGGSPITHAEHINRDRESDILWFPREKTVKNAEDPIRIRNMCLMRGESKCLPSF